MIKKHSYSKIDKLNTHSNLIENSDELDINILFSLETYELDILDEIFRFNADIVNINKEYIS